MKRLVKAGCGAVLLGFLVAGSLAGQPWSTVTFVDEWGDQTDDVGARSTLVEGSGLSFPYNDTRGQIFVNCDNAWLRFTDAPNLTGGDISDGYHTYRLLIRIDGEESRLTVRQTWGAKDLNVVFSSEFIRNISAGSQLDVLLPWYESRAVFRWSLAGSSDAIKQSC